MSCTGYYRKAVACMPLKKFKEAEIVLADGIQLLSAGDKDSADMKRLLEHAQFLSRVTSYGTNLFLFLFLSFFFVEC